MSALTDLISKITDEDLRKRIQDEVERLTKQKKFGLVFERHLPECTPLYDVPIRRGMQVAPKNDLNNRWFVFSVSPDGTARCKRKESTETAFFPVSELVCIADFGEPIYPCLQPVDTVCNAPDSDLWHTLIQADNYHALQLLEYLYEGKVDCIYIDPPYNTGARDWKYNNNYVDGNDAYRHSKWLSFMEKRLKLAKKLLNPRDSVLIVTIDEKEYLHLGCLLEEMFPEAGIQMISSVVNPSGVARKSEFYRTDEYIFILRFGRCAPQKLLLTEDWITGRTSGKDKLRWRPIRRQGSADNRNDSANLFYPIYLSDDGKCILGAGESLPRGTRREDAVIPEGVKNIVWPIKPNGTEGHWQISQKTLSGLMKKGYVKVTWTKKWGFVPQYLAEGEQEKVERGQFPITGRDKYGTILTDEAVSEAPFIPGTQWRIPSHSARDFGASILNKILAGKIFDFPKSLYATHDTIRFFVANKPDALILDFFAGSGTTLHAVALLNAEDGGHRRCIIVTNNEVSDDEAKSLTARGLHPGEEEWEKLGIARYVTWPRTVCSIEGHDVNGKPLAGNYIGSDRPMADGFAANAIFFKLGFLDKDTVALGMQFRELLPILWMKAGAHGPCPSIAPAEDIPDMLVFPENRFAVLLEEDSFLTFKDELEKHPEISVAFLVTDSEYAYRQMTSALSVADSIQLYRDYLDNFRINTGK